MSGLSAQIFDLCVPKTRPYRSSGMSVLVEDAAGLEAPPARTRA
jgi:hypothetical protein